MLVFADLCTPFQCAVQMSLWFLFPLLPSRLLWRTICLDSSNPRAYYMYDLFPVDYSLRCLVRAEPSECYVTSAITPLLPPLLVTG